MSELPQADRFCDERDANPYWNESVWFSFSKPEDHIHGLIQYYFRPNMGMLNGGPVMWDPSGLTQWDCLHYNWSHLQALPPGAQKFDMKANNSLEVKVLEPLTRYAIKYSYDGFEIDLVWQAIGPVHELKTGDAGQQATAKFHIEQPGRMKGMVRRDGKEYPIDCFSMRDTSYGRRDYASLATGGYFWGIAAESSFHAIAMGDAEQKVIGGYIYKDGQLSSLASGVRRITEFGRYGPSRAVFEATDKLGRIMTATAEIDPGLIFTGYTDHTVVWSLVKWDWDGVTHWGDNQEFCSTERFRKIARGELALG
ncbi:hypothetical protein LJR219_004550 [Phenylobacterium sp. LjRoot219]|uniref:DUF7065 domain-containing protein n=1 Tax=Phenylobacterium sp. LjRoot219 TaxID=3342283 RepID=UPI003ED0F680